MRAPLIVSILAIGLVVGACSDSTDDDTSTTPTTAAAAVTTSQPATTVTTTATSSTTTTTPTSAEMDADVAVVEEYFAAGEAWRDYMEPGVLIRYGENRGTGLTFGAEGVPDWDGDGLISQADYFERDLVVLRRFATRFDVACEPSEQLGTHLGPEVLCTVEESYLFYDRAGETGARWSQVFVVEDGLIAEITVAEFEENPEADRAWDEQAQIFEQWVYDSYPDQYTALFVGACCPSEEWIFNPETVDTFLELQEEWASG